MLGPLLGQGVETEREHAKNVTGVAFWRGSKPNARGSKPNARSISRDRRSTVALSLAKKLFDIKPSMYTWQAWHCGEGWNWTRWGQNRRRGPFLVAGAWLCHLQRNGSISYLPSIIRDRRGIVERVGQNRRRGPFLVVGAALLTISSGVFLCGSATCKEMVRYTFYVGVALWRGSKPTAGGNAWSISCGRRSAFDGSGPNHLLNGMILQARQCLLLFFWCNFATEQVEKVHDIMSHPYRPALFWWNPFLEAV